MADVFSNLHIQSKKQRHQKTSPSIVNNNTNRQRGSNDVNSGRNNPINSNSHNRHLPYQHRTQSKTQTQTRKAKTVNVAPKKKLAQLKQSEETNNLEMMRCGGVPHHNKI
jgi:hypothetical protein